MSSKSKSQDGSEKEPEKTKSGPNSISLKVGGGQEVTVAAPTRDMFAGNLAGAVEFTLAHLMFTVLDLFGGAMGSFFGGVAVSFLDRIEPSLVKYAKPLLDMVLELPELDPTLRKFLEQLASPTDAGAATILSGFASQAGGMVFNSVFGAILAPLTMQLNAKIRPAIPNNSDVLRMWRRNQLSDAGMRNLFEFMGYKDELIDAYLEVSQERSGIINWIDGYFRETVTMEDLQTEAKAQGVPNEVLNLHVALHQQLFNVQELLNGYYRKTITPAEYSQQMEWLGYPPERSSLLLQMVEPIPPLSDIIHMAVRDAWRDDVAGQWGYDDDYQPIVGEYLAKLGFDADWATRYWRAHWELPSITSATEMVHRKIITEADFKTMLRVADYPRGWRDAMTAAIYSPYTRVDTRRMYRLGVLNEQEVTAAYQALGYDLEKAQRLTDFTVKYESSDPENKPERYKDLTTSMLEQAYSKRLLSPAEYQTQLMDLGYDAEEIGIITGLAELKRSVGNAVDYFPQFQRDMIAIIERAFSQGMIDAGTAGSYLSQSGVADGAIDYIITAAELVRDENDKERRLSVIKTGYVNQSVSDQTVYQQLGELNIPAAEQQRLLEDWDIERRSQTRRLTEAQYRNAWRTNIIPQEGYVSACQALGYSPDDITLLVAMYRPTKE